MTIYIMSNRVSKAKEIKVIWSQDNKQSTLFQNGEILQFPGRARGGHPWGRRQTCCRWLLCWMVSNLQTATGHARSLACPVDMPPCKIHCPEIAKLAAQEKDVVFLRVDITQNQEAAEHFCSNPLQPTFVLFKGGAMVDEVTGVTELKEAIYKHK